MDKENYVMASPDVKDMYKVLISTRNTRQDMQSAITEYMSFRYEIVREVEDEDNVIVIMKKYQE